METTQPNLDEIADGIYRISTFVPGVTPSGNCPYLSPQVAEQAAGLFFSQGPKGFYDMTSPERCYRDAAAAEADGMRAPKR